MYVSPALGLRLSSVSIAKSSVKTGHRQPPRFGEIKLPDKQLLLNEIKEQPAALERLLKEAPGDIERLHLPKRPPQKITLIGEGSSKNALDAAAPFVSAWMRLPVSTHLPAPYLNQPPSCNIRQSWGRPWDLIAAVSQSGKSASTLKALEHVVQQGNAHNHDFRLIPITNSPQSRMAQLYGNHVYMRAGNEDSIAATKSMTNSIMATLIMGAHLAKRWEENFSPNGPMEQLQAIPQKLKTFLDTPAVHEQLKTFTQKLAGHHQFVLLSQGAMASVLPECALKMTETSSNLVQSYNTESFKHGPKVILDHSPAVLYLVPPALNETDSKTFYDDMQEHVRNASSKPFSGKNRFIVRYENSPKVPDDLLKGENAPVVVTLPGAANFKTPIESMFLGIVTFQLLSYYLAEAKGVNPNHPALTKAVTQ